MTHQFHSSPLNPITLTLPVLLVLLGLFQGPFVKTSQRPRARPCSLSCFLLSSRNLYHHSAWMRRAWAGVEPAAWGRGCGGDWANAQTRVLPQSLGEPGSITGFSANPRTSSFHYFLNHILLGPWLRGKRCHLLKVLPSYLRPTLFS